MLSNPSKRDQRSTPPAPAPPSALPLTAAMDIIAFISAQRQEVQLLADYNAYRALCTRRLATLRKRLQRVNSKSKKFTPAPPVTAEDLAAKPECVSMFSILQCLC